MAIIGLLFIAIVAVALVVFVFQTKKAPTEMRARAADPCEAYNRGKPIPKSGFLGTIQSMKEDSFVLRIGGGSVSKIIVVCAGTTITNKSNAKLSYKNLAVGNKVTVAGNYGDNTGTTILSTSVTQNSKSSDPSPMPTTQVLLTPMPTPFDCKSRMTLTDCNAAGYSNCAWYSCVNNCLPRGSSGVCSVIYSNLNMNLGAKSASFSFSYSGTPAKNFYVAMSTDPKMLTDVYLSFAQGPGSPVSQNNPTKWDKYSCGRTLYWRVTTEYPGTGWASYKPELMSDIASGNVSCQ